MLYGFKINVKGNSFITSTKTKINALKIAGFNNGNSIFLNVYKFPLPKRLDVSAKDFPYFNELASIGEYATAKYLII